MIDDFGSNLVQNEHYDWVAFQTDPRDNLMIKLSNTVVSHKNTNTDVNALLLINFSTGQTQVLSRVTRIKWLLFLLSISQI